MIRDFIKDYKLAFVVSVIVFIGLIALTAYFIIVRSGKEPVTIQLIPSDTTLAVNGSQLHEGVSYLVPGTYTIEASRNGFESIQKKIVIKTPNTATIDLALSPKSDNAVKWKKDNMKLYQDYEGRAGVRARKEGETFTALNPITAVLPFENFLYTIGYRADTSDPSGNSILIEIDAMSGYRNAAIKKISELGYDPTNFKIIFTNYKSPF